MGHWHDFGSRWYKPSRPREVKGGIKAQSKQGFGKSWWARRWIQVLESYDIGARLERGRSYARSGQVLSIDVQEGEVTAKVQGSRPSPYKVKIKMLALGKKDWKKVATVLSGKAIFSAKLLAGEMPQNIEEAFDEAGTPLFPKSHKDLTTDCSCPDWSNPCKHIAAVYYLLGEEFDRNPFLIFKLRGMDRDELVGLLGSNVSETGAAKKGSVPKVPTPEAISIPATQPLESDPEKFWRGGPAGELPIIETSFPSMAAALPKFLGPFPFWRGNEPFLDLLDIAYRQASQGGMAIFMGDILRSQ